MIQSACRGGALCEDRRMARASMSCFASGKPPSVVFYEMSVFFIKNRKINLHKIKTDAILYKREFL